VRDQLESGLSEQTSEFQIDHLMVGAAVLAEGCAWLTEKMGASTTPGGRHPGQGTVNALLGLNQQCYLEVIAPDPDLTELAGLARSLKALSAPVLRTFAVRCSGFDHLIPVLTDNGFDYIRQAMSRETLNGERLSWELLFVQNHPFGQQMPFFIDWQDSVHPCTDLVPSGHLKRLIVRLDHDADRYRKFVSGLGLPLSLELGVPGLAADIETLGGAVQL
jgi:hypothetical protein